MEFSQGSIVSNFRELAARPSAPRETPALHDLTKVCSLLQPYFLKLTCES